MKLKKINNEQADKLSLKPLYSIKYISKATTRTIKKESISTKIIGHKAFGLSCLPKSWTLPFVCISDKLFSTYCDCRKVDTQKKIVLTWATQIKKSALENGIEKDAPIIIRSSGCSEGLDQRGKFHSFEGFLSQLQIALSICLKKLSSDADLKEQKIPLVVQVYSKPTKAKGHLSNEKRWCEETRDWIVEYEHFKKNTISNASNISLRNWRKKIIVENFLQHPLICNLSPMISEVLKIPASWAYQQKARLHFEWCWDGTKIIIVQADLEQKSFGIYPTILKRTNRILSEHFHPKCLKEISEENTRYNKIKNVFIYLKLNLIKKTNLYILDDQNIIQNLASDGDINPLLEDLKELVKDSLVIRMDIDTDDIVKRQLLPRTNEVRDLAQAVGWLKNESKKIVDHTEQETVVFIFHNFIPAVASAFTYAAPGKRNVQIEALWGLPEGLLQCT